MEGSYFDANGLQIQAQGEGVVQRSLMASLDGRRSQPPSPAKPSTLPKRASRKHSVSIIATKSTSNPDLAKAPRDRSVSLNPVKVSPPASPNRGVVAAYEVGWVGGALSWEDLDRHVLTVGGQVQVQKRRQFTPLTKMRGHMRYRALENVAAPSDKPDGASGSSMMRNWLCRAEWDSLEPSPQACSLLASPLPSELHLIAVQMTPAMWALAGCQPEERGADGEGDGGAEGSGRGGRGPSQPAFRGGITLRMPMEADHQQACLELIAASSSPRLQQSPFLRLPAVGCYQLMLWATERAPSGLFAMADVYVAGVSQHYVPSCSCPPLAFPQSIVRFVGRRPSQQRFRSPVPAPPAAESRAVGDDASDTACVLDLPLASHQLPEWNVAKLSDGLHQDLLLVLDAELLPLADSKARAAQLALQLGIDAFPVLWSWSPFRAACAEHDSEALHRTSSQTLSFRSFLLELALNFLGDAGRMHIVCLNPGASLFLDAFSHLVPNHLFASKIAQVILIEPDLKDHQLLPVLANISRTGNLSVCVYSSKPLAAAAAEAGIGLPQQSHGHTPYDSFDAPPPLRFVHMQDCRPIDAHLGCYIHSNPTLHRQLDPRAPTVPDSTTQSANEAAPDPHSFSTSLSAHCYPGIASKYAVASFSHRGSTSAASLALFVGASGALELLLKPGTVPLQGSGSLWILCPVAITERPSDALHVVDPDFMAPSLYRSPGRRLYLYSVHAESFLGCTGDGQLFIRDQPQPSCEWELCFSLSKDPSASSASSSSPMLFLRHASSEAVLCQPDQPSPEGFAQLKLLPARSSGQIPWTLALSYQPLHLGSAPKDARLQKSLEAARIAATWLDRSIDISDW